MSAIKKLLLGKVGENSHPVHPATVHLPLAFLLAACALDVSQRTFLTIPGLAIPILKIITGDAASPVIPLVRSMSQLSYLSTIAFIITSVPALSTGVMELLALIQARGLEDHAVKIGLLHAGLNDVALVGMIYNWFTRRKREAVLSTTDNVFISAGLLLGGLYAAYLGGSLIYSHGVGVQRMGAGAKERRSKGESLPAPEASGIPSKGGLKGEARALEDSTRDTIDKAYAKAQDVNQYAQQQAGEVRQRAGETASRAQERFGQAGQHVEQRAGDARQYAQQTEQQAQTQYATQQRQDAHYGTQQGFRKEL